MSAAGWFLKHYPTMKGVRVLLDFMIELAGTAGHLSSLA
jgi:hypothetical protein